MGRQRTVDDANFWRSPLIADCTQEDRATLLYLLTSPSSNIVGVYQIVMRVAAAEMGWTAEQLVPVLRRLQAADLIGYDEACSFVWVKVWWEHNSAKMACGPKLRERTRAQIRAIPMQWQSAFMDDFQAKLPPELPSARELLAGSSPSLDVGHSITDRVPDTLSANSRYNTNNTYKNNFNGNAAGAGRAAPPRLDLTGALAGVPAKVSSTASPPGNGAWRLASDIGRQALETIRSIQAPQPAAAQGGTPSVPETKGTE